MAKSTLSRRGGIRVAAVSLLTGVIIAACSPMSDEPAPVYVVRITSSAVPEAVAAAPIEREMTGPVALAPSMMPATAVAHPVSDVIALDEHPSQPAPAPARQASEPVAIAAMPPPAPASIPMPAPATAPAVTPMPTRTLVALPAPVATPSARPEPSAAAEAGADPAPAPAREQTTPAPARADIATPGLFVKVKDDRARYRPRYYYSP